MELRVDPKVPVPVYEQLRAQLTRLIAGGRIVDETRLPTIRQLAADLGVAKGTVERAYALLEAEGVIVTRGRSGTFAVAPRGVDRQPAEADLGDLRDAADTMALVAHQLGVDGSVAQAALREAIARLRPA